jgi:hypothetical protein
VSRRSHPQLKAANSREESRDLHSETFSSSSD